MRPVYEHRSHAVLPRPLFAWRFLRHLGAVALLAGGSLLAGMLGYRYYGPMGWTDAFLNAAMLMGGMGPATELSSNTAKIFAGCYALYAGLVFMVSVTILMAPVVHRVLHRLHADGKGR
jgi:hypothetical protein